MLGDYLSIIPDPYFFIKHFVYFFCKLHIEPTWEATLEEGGPGRTFSDQIENVLRKAGALSETNRRACVNV